jgi:hypothetical protein
MLGCFYTADGSVPAQSPLYNEEWPILHLQDSQERPMDAWQIFGKPPVLNGNGQSHQSPFRWFSQQTFIQKNPSHVWLQGNHTSMSWIFPVHEKMARATSRKRPVLAVGSLTQIQEPLGDPHMNLGGGWQIPSQNGGFELGKSSRIMVVNGGWWWLMMVNYLVGGDSTILKNDGLRQWVSDDIPYMKWKIKHVWNHQPDL